MAGGKLVNLKRKHVQKLREALLHHRRMCSCEQHKICDGICAQGYQRVLDKLQATHPPSCHVSMSERIESAPLRRYLKRDFELSQLGPLSAGWLRRLGQVPKRAPPGISRHDTDSQVARQLRKLLVDVVTEPFERRQ